MPLACLQLHPDRLTSPSAEAAILALFKKHIPGAQLLPGNDGGRFINVLFEIDSPAHAIELFVPFLDHRTLGQQITSSTILTTEGDQSWDDYFLLHHFDPTEELDEIDEEH
jgi:hypothetical protein